MHLHCFFLVSSQFIFYSIRESFRTTFVVTTLTDKVPIAFTVNGCVWQKVFITETVDQLCTNSVDELAAEAHMSALKVKAQMIKG